MLGRPFCLFIVVLLVASSSLVLDVSTQETPLSSHAPIRIVGDSGFTPGNGVVSGSGTTADPYVIERWDISNSVAPGILVIGTSAFFVIRHVSIHYEGEIPPDGLERAIFLEQTARDGIVLQEVSNGRIENTAVSFSRWAILLEYSSNNVVVNNELEDLFGGVQILGGSDNVVDSNSIRRHLWAAVEAASPRTIVRHNRASLGGFCWKNPLSGCFPGNGLVIAYASGCLVIDNVVTENIGGIRLVGADNTIVANNTLVGNGVEVVDSRSVSVLGNTITGSGIGVLFGSNHTLTGNVVRGASRFGIVLTVTSNNLLRDNTVDASPVGIWLQRAIYNTIVGNVLSNGNIGIFLCGEIYGNSYAPPVNDFTGTRMPFFHCNRGVLQIP